MKTDRATLVLSSTVYALMIAINAIWMASLWNTGARPIVWLNVLAVAIISGVWGYTLARLTDNRGGR